MIAVSKEILTEKTQKESTGIILGVSKGHDEVLKTEDELLNLEVDNPTVNRNIAVFGDPGSDKTEGFTIPYCYQVAKRRESIVIDDCGGHLYHNLSMYFEEKGYEVKCLNLIDKGKSNSWNCIENIDAENAKLDAELLAEFMLGESKETALAASLKATILEVYWNHDFVSADKCMESIIEKFPEETTRLRKVKESFQDKQPEDNDINFTTLAKKPCAYFCIYPKTHSVYAPVVSLFYSQMLHVLNTYLEKKIDNLAGVYHVNFLFNRFPDDECIPNLSKYIASTRKKKMSFAIVFEDVKAVKNIYPDTWQAIFSNCATWVAYPNTNPDNKELLNTLIFQGSAYEWKKVDKYHYTQHPESEVGKLYCPYF